jgi:small GTP-binding protein
VPPWGEWSGKTSLIRKFVLDTFDDKYISTIGTKVTKKTQSFEHEGISITMDMMIWDIMGQSSFRTLLKDSYFYGASGVIAVCDATRRDTLSSIDEWIASVRDVVGEVPIVILANKSDLDDQIQVTASDLELKAKKYKAPHWFTSAKCGDNVNDAFQGMGVAIVQRQVKGGK